MKREAGFFEGLWRFIWSWIQQSKLYGLLRKVYDGISDCWKESRIAGWFRQRHASSKILEESWIGRTFRLPFTFLEWLQRRFGERLRRWISESRILQGCRCYLHSMLALDFRFLGSVLISLSIGLLLSALAQKTEIGHWLWVIGGLGVCLCLLNAKGTDWLKHAKLVNIICKCFGIETAFSWYDEEVVSRKQRLLVGSIFGFVCGVAGGFTAPILGAALLIGLMLMLLILEKPVSGVFLLVFLAPLLPTMAMVALAVYSFGALMVHSLIRKDFRWQYDGLGFLILAFFLVYTIAALTSFAPKKSITIWAVYGAFISGYFLVINLIKTKKQLQGILVSFVLSGLVVCGYGILQYIFGWNTAQAWMDETMFSDIRMRIYSTLENPNVLGEYILLVLPVSVALAWTRKEPLTKLVYSGIAVLMFVALILTFSRGCWIGLLFAAAIFITFTAGKLWGLALVALPLLPMLLPESIINRFSSIGDMEDSSTSYRVYIWMGTLAMIRDFWFSGIGMGAEAFTAVYPFYSYNGIVAPHSHNLFLQILVESGVVGILVFLLILVFFLRKMMLGYQIGGKGKPLSVMMTALSAGICGFLLQGMFDNCFYNYRVLLIFWCVLGIATACVNVAKKSETEEVIIK